MLRYTADLETPALQRARWINLDNRVVMDTWTGHRVRLTCGKTWTDENCMAHAMEVIGVLNRIYARQEGYRA